MSLIKKGQCIKLSMLAYDEYLAVVQHLREEANNDYIAFTAGEYEHYLTEYLGIDCYGDLEECTHPYNFLPVNEWQKAPYKDLKDHDYPNILYQEEVTDLLLKIQYKKPVAHISDLEIVQKALAKIDGALFQENEEWYVCEISYLGDYHTEVVANGSCSGSLLTWAKQTLENNHDRT